MQITGLFSETLSSNKNTQATALLYIGQQYLPVLCSCHIRTIVFENIHLLEATTT